MNPFDFPFALIAFFGLVAVVPVWMFFVFRYPPAQALPMEARFLATLTLPAVVALFAASWLQTG
jgi:hypothetical protein